MCSEGAWYEENLKTSRTFTYGTALADDTGPNAIARYMSDRSMNLE